MPSCEIAHPDGQGRDANASPPTTSASPSRCPWCTIAICEPLFPRKGSRARNRPFTPR